MFTSKASNSAAAAAAAAGDIGEEGGRFTDMAGWRRLVVRSEAVAFWIIPSLWSLLVGWPMTPVVFWLTGVISEDQSPRKLPILAKRKGLSTLTDTCYKIKWITSLMIGVIMIAETADRCSAPHNFRYGYLFCSPLCSHQKQSLTAWTFPTLSFRWLFLPSFVPESIAQLPSNSHVRFLTPRKSSFGLVGITAQRPSQVGFLFGRTPTNCPGL